VRGKEERRERCEEDDLRARPDFFNSKLWLDESARKVRQSGALSSSFASPRGKAAGWLVPTAGREGFR